MKKCMVSIFLALCLTMSIAASVTVHAAQIPKSSASKITQQAPAPKYFIKYTKPLGSGGSMADSVATYGQNTILRKNNYDCRGYLFNGWTARRNSDGKWLYRNGSVGQSDWYDLNKQPQGWKMYILSDGRIVRNLSNINRDTIVLHAKWNPIQYTIRYKTGIGSGSMANTAAAFNKNISLNKNRFSNGCRKFIGWTARRNSDGKWLYRNPTTGECNWYLQNKQPNGWKMYRLSNGRTVRNLSSVHHDVIDLYAKWENETLKAMSFNIRVNNASANASKRDKQRGKYPNYAAMVTQTILKNNPDTVGLQEVDDSWYKYLKSNTKLNRTYDFIGTGRNWNKTGERNTIMYNKKKFRVVSKGTLWLTASGQFGIAKGENHPRIFTYAMLERKTKDKQRYMIINTHLALNRSARVEQIGYLKKFIAKYKNKYPVIVSGDMNTEINEKQVYNKLADMGLKNASVVAAYNSDLKTATFTRYHKYNKILDYIFINQNKATVSRYKVCDNTINGFDVSDHYPIVVEYKAR